ncbi:MAG TPA: long-chain fatty acid--CoA ligase [Thermoplasmata archaeon]|nr:long-chain fatty acid--CoA ligase [Thermoplasmata archaeon]
MASAATVPGDRPWLRKYPPGVPAHVDVPDQLVTELVAESVRRWPDRPALLFYGARWSYARLWRESGRFAAALAAEGIGPGDRVALYLPNCPAYPIALFGLLRLGAVAVQVSPLYLGQDLGRLLESSRPKALVTLEILYPHYAALAGSNPVPVVFVARLREFYPWYLKPFVNLVLRRQGRSTAFPSGPSVRAWRRALRSTGPAPTWRGDPGRSVAVLQYTGGTTGAPRGPMLTHRNLVANVAQLNAWYTTQRPGEEVILATIPFFHVYGLTVALLLGMSQGATVVLQTRPDIPELLKLIDRHRPTQFPGVPALYQALLDRPDLSRHDLRSIRYCLSGSAPLPVELQRRFEQLTGASLVEGYGLSETSPVTHANPVAGERRAGSIGLPIPDTEQRIVDPAAADRSLPVGEAGELAVRGPQVMLGYFEQPEETAAALRDGWLLTGDIARLDADGYAYLVDRKKDVIIVGGFKVYPREVEEVLFQHPAVTDAAVVGVPDVGHGEVPKAFVVPRAGATVSEAELIAFVRERIAHYKAPRSVEFRTALPRSGVQKVLRRALRESGPPATARAR